LIATGLGVAMLASTPASSSVKRLLGPPLTGQTPPAKGPVASIVWDLPLGEPASLNPIQAATLSPQGIIANFCDGLYYTDAATHKVVPDLAASFRQPNPRTLIYEIRKGV